MNDSVVVHVLQSYDTASYKELFESPSSGADIFFNNTFGYDGTQNPPTKNGFSLNEAETFEYVYGIGAPIVDSQRRAIAGIAISGTKGSINVKSIPDLANKVTNTAKLISQKLQES